MNTLGYSLPFLILVPAALGIAFILQGVCCG